MYDTIADSIIYGKKSDVLHYLETHPDTLLDATDEYGYTPLIEACIMNKTDIAHILIARGAKINHADMTGRTPLFWASDNHNIALSRMLLEQGADANAYTLGSQPILVSPLLRNQTKLKNLLIEYGADIHFARDYIRTKLLSHRYSLQGVVDIVNHKGNFLEVSCEGFILEFTLQTVTHSLNRFLENFSARSLRRYFPYLRQIHKALNHATSLIRYQHYLCNRETLRNEIESLLSGNIQIIPVLYEGHAISFVRYGRFWVRCDRGEYGKQHGCIRIFKTRHPNAFNSRLFFDLLYTKHKTEYINVDLEHELGLEEVTQIPITHQVAGNCSWANMEASILALFYLSATMTLLESNQKPPHDYVDLSLDIFYKWQEWDQNQALDSAIHDFQHTSIARQASIASLLGDVFLQQCHHHNLRDLQRAKKILQILIEPKFRYILKSYLDAYCEPKPTPACKNIREFLEDCGIDYEKIE